MSQAGLEFTKTPDLDSLSLGFASLIGITGEPFYIPDERAESELFKFPNALKGLSPLRSTLRTPGEEKVGARLKPQLREGRPAATSFVVPFPSGP